MDLGCPIGKNADIKSRLPVRSGQGPMRETMTLLRILALGERQIEAGRVHSATDGIARLRKRRQTD